MKKNHIPLLAAGIAVIVILAAVLIGVLHAGNQTDPLTKQLSLGERYLAEFDYESAILAYEKAIEIDPKSADAYLGMAKALLALGRTGEAVQILAEGYEATGDARLAAMLGELEPTGEGGEASDTDVPDTDADTDDTPPYIIIPGDAPSGGTVLDGGALTFKDPALEAAVREALGKPAGEILASEAAGIQELDLYDCGVTDLSGIEALTGLVWLEISNNSITDLSPLASLIGLEMLYADSNQISDISPLKNLTNLTWLTLQENRITDLSALRGLTKLESLQLHNNRISDLSPLDGMSALTELLLYTNAITDLKPLANLKALVYLDISDNQVTDLAPLASLAGLEFLSAHTNKITDLAPLANLTALEKLQIGGNPITDFSPVAHVAKVNGRPE